MRTSPSPQVVDERVATDAVAAERDASEMALEDARSAEEERTGVFAMVTHDLRSPLSVIVGNADMTAEGAEEDLVATFDHDRVVQLLSNLLGNAVKFTPRGGSVDLWVERDPEKAVFVVRDDGAGIPPSALSHLFERFWQSDTDRRRGLGLGLYLCRTIARAHGGEISVQSEVGSGSTFRVRLPMSR